MEYCPCQTSGHFCMNCERELIAEMNQREAEIKQKERERKLEELSHTLDLLDKYPTPLVDQAKSYVYAKINKIIEEM